MNCKKNVISVILWFLSAIMAGTGAAMVVMPQFASSDNSRWIGLVITSVWLAVTGLVAFLLTRILQNKKADKGEENRQALPIVEAVCVVLLLAAGIALRVQEIRLLDLDAAVENVWFTATMVTSDTQIPLVVHGAVYSYLQLLHGMLVFLGNKVIVALGLQVVLQILGCLFGYFAVRKLTGTVAAVISLGFGMLAPLFFAVTALGPETFYLMLWMIGLCFAATALDSFQRKGAQKGIRSILGFFVSGVVTGVLMYLDISGVLLLLPLLAVFTVETIEETRFVHRIWAALLAGFGGAAGFFISIALDACASGKLMGNVLTAWSQLFVPGKFSWMIDVYTAPATNTSLVNAQVWVGLLCTLQILGVFGFWFQKRRERQSIWMLLCIGAGLLLLCGMMTEEIQGIGVLLVSAVTLAGAGLQSVIPYATLTEGTTEELLISEEGKTEKKRKSRLQIQDLETEEFSEEKSRSEAEKPEEETQIRYIENPLPLPKKHVPKVLDYKLDAEDTGDFDYPVADDDDFDL